MFYLCGNIVVLINVLMWLPALSGLWTSPADLGKLEIFRYECGGASYNISAQALRGDSYFMKGGGGGGVDLCHQGETFWRRVAGEKEMWEVLSRKRGFQLMCSLAPARAGCVSALMRITSLHEKISRCLSCCRSVFTTHSLKDTSFWFVIIGSNFCFLKLLGFSFIFFLCQGQSTDRSLQNTMKGHVWT